MPHRALLDTLAQPACLLCHLASQSARTYLKGVVQDGVNDPRLRSDWRRRGGLCGPHWAEVRTLEAPALPATILARDLLASYLATGRPDLDCPACQVAAEAMRRNVRSLRRLSAPTVATVLADSPGFLCLEHLETLPSGPLRQAFADRLERLLEELETFERKMDYRFAREPIGAERDSWLRAIRALGGRV